MILTINKELILENLNELKANTITGALQGSGMMGIGSQVLPLITGEESGMDLGHAILTGAGVGAGKGILSTGLQYGMDKYNIPNPKEYIKTKIKEI